jgi:hypothetical protein
MTVHRTRHAVLTFAALLIAGLTSAAPAATAATLHHIPHDVVLQTSGPPQGLQVREPHGAMPSHVATAQSAVDPFADLHFE